MLAAAPVLGATLVVFLPFVGFALFAVAGFRKVAGLDKTARPPSPRARRADPDTRHAIKEKRRKRSIP